LTKPGIAGVEVFSGTGVVTSNAFFSCPIGKFFLLKQDYEDGKSQQYAQTELDTSSIDEKTKILLIQHKGAVISMEILDMWMDGKDKWPGRKKNGD
jgi:hypothetical protein